MRILKILLVFVSIYFIRKFIHLYQVMKKIQKDHELNHKKPPAAASTQEKEVVDAEFRVL